MTPQIDHIEFSPEVKKWAKKWTKDQDFLKHIEFQGNPLTKAIAALMKEATVGREIMIPNDLKAPPPTKSENAPNNQLLARENIMLPGGTPNTPGCFGDYVALDQCVACDFRLLCARRSQGEEE